MLKLNLHCGNYEPRTYTTLFRFLYTTMYIAAASGRDNTTDERIVEIWRQPVQAETVAKLHELVAAAWGRLGGPGRKLHRNEDFQRPLIAKAAQLLV